MPIILSLIHFWLCHPALFYGLAFFLGISCFLENSLWLMLPCLTLWFPFIIAIKKHHAILKILILSLVTFVTAWLYAAVYYSFPILPPQGIVGKAHVKVKNIRLEYSLFDNHWLYRCELQQFFPDHSSQSITAHLPCLVLLPLGSNRPLANQDYWVTGKLIQNTQGLYLLKVSSKTHWVAILGSRSWAEQRYQWKRKVTNWIESQLAYPVSANFLAGLATGEFDDYWMKQQFARFGLQHLLAISGFHFAIIASFLSFLFRLFFSQRFQMINLLLLLAIYCFFLGPQPSILRAWLMCSLTLLGGLFEKQTNALNLLGFALLAILGYYPLLSQEIGFRLSFATTIAILLFYPLAHTWLNDLFLKRSLSEVMKMSSWNQHGYCVLAFLRKGIALTLAVNAFALPLTLYHFHQFPWMSLLYNLFFPFLASGSLCLLLLGGLLSFIPCLAKTIHHFNDFYTYSLLQLTYQVPSEVDAYLQFDSFHFCWLILYLCIASLMGIIWHEKYSSSSPKENFAFI